MQPFTVVENPAFRDLFLGMPGNQQLISSAATLKRRIVSEFEQERTQLKAMLQDQSKTIALSLDAWTSSNHLPILAIIGHGVSPDFTYQEHILEFCELEGMPYRTYCN
jgi:hypothetical protein